MNNYLPGEEDEITLSELLKDEVFVDFFNTFLNLPVSNFVIFWNQAICHIFSQKNSVYHSFFFSFLTILKVFGQTPLYFLCDNKWVLCPEVKLSQVGPLIHSFIHSYKENKLKVALISHNNYLYVPCSQRMEQGFYSGWHPSGWPCLNKLNFIITICYAQRSCSFRSLKPKVNSCSSYT